MVQDVDCFVLSLGWAAYHWEKRRNILPRLLRHGLQGAELRRMCSLACCSQIVRMELHDAAVLDTAAESVLCSQNRPGPSPHDAWHPASVHFTERESYQTDDMIGVSPGARPHHTFMQYMRGI
jgi:hypothetical protein